MLTQYAVSSSARSATASDSTRERVIRMPDCEHRRVRFQLVIGMRDSHERSVEAATQ
jgi:hypothetical protein